VILTTEELVDEAVIRSDPNRTLVPGLWWMRSVMCSCLPPILCQGYYDRDNAFYLDWDRISQSAADTGKWLDEWVMGVGDRNQYWNKLGPETHAACTSSLVFARASTMGPIDACSCPRLRIEPPASVDLPSVVRSWRSAGPGPN